MSQVGLANMFLGSTANINTSMNTTVNSSSISNDQKQSFSQNLSKAKETIGSSERCGTTKKQSNVTEQKQDKKVVTDDKMDTQDRNSVKDSKEVRDDKEVKDIQSVQENEQAPSVNEVDATLETQESEEADITAAIDEQILAIMSQVLQIPIEEIQGQLETLGLEVQDLLTEEGFGKLINQLFADGDVEALLAGDIDIKQISALFDQITTVAEEMQIVLEETTTVPVEMQNLLKTGQASVETEHSIVQSEGLLDEVTYDQVAIQQESGKSFNQQEQTSDEQIFNFMNGENQEDSGLGMTVPIHNFTTTTFTQTFETEAGVISQTTTKQMMNGKAFIEQVDFKVLSQTKEINVSLSPKELGQMNIKIIEQNGSMVAEIKVDNEKAKEFILNEINTLKESLEEQGLNVTDVKVDVRQDNHQAQMEQERQKSSKRIQEIISRHLNEEESEEEVVETPIRGDSEVDYMV